MSWLLHSHPWGAHRVGFPPEETLLLEKDDADGYLCCVRNLRRDPRAALCVFVEAFRGPWVQIEGTAEIVTLPEAMEPLVDYYRRLAGEHPDWDDYRRAMTADRRALIRITIERAGPDRQG